MTALRTRKPTGVAPWPLVLVEGAEKSGKSYAAAQFTASERISAAYWLDLGEGAADEYAAMPGASYDVLVHDGTWGQILEQVKAVHAEGARVLADGGKPILLVVDSMTEVWELLKDWIGQRARRSKAGKKQLADDPDAEVKPHNSLWNDANDRHNQLMRLLMTFPGIAVVTARGKEVAAIDAGGNPDPRAKKEYRVEGQKNLAFQVSAWVRLSREDPPTVVGVRSLHAGLRPGIDKPLRNPDLTLEWLVFEHMQAGGAVRQLVVKPSFEDVSAAVDEASDLESLRAAWTLARDADYLDAGDPTLRDRLDEKSKKLESAVQS